VVRRAEGIVQVARTERPFSSIAELDEAHYELEAVLARLPRPQLAILVDLREAPSRNDPEFETAMGPHRKRMFEGFARRGVLVRTAAGKLQVQRHARSDRHNDLQTFVDPIAAISTLRMR
jgi:hypothetical protein